VTIERKNYHLIELSPAPASAEVWHLWTVIVPRRSITGCLVELSGDVEMGATGVYKKFTEYEQERAE
jgi:hypothetical protein